MSDKTPAVPAVMAMRAGAKPLGIVPTTFEECFRMAKLFATTTMVPEAFRGNPDACCVAIMQGLEVGLSPLAALQSIAVINGRPSLWGDGALAVVRASGLLEFFRESDDGTTATCIIKRRDEPDPIVRRFSMQDAERANLTNKTGPWKLYPHRMRQMRARSWALRDGFADVMKGLYIAEEAQDISMKDITPQKQVALEVPDDIPDETVQVSEAEDNQDAPFPHPERYLAHLGEELEAAPDLATFDEIWESHTLGSDGRLSKEHETAAEALHDKHVKRFE